MQIAEILYKFRNFDERAISMLANNQIYFSNPLDFNDPFDCLAQEHVFVEIRPESIEQLALAQGIPQTAISREKTMMLIEEFHRTPQVIQIQEEQKKALEEYVESCGVLSLSARNDSILMWSHYASYHKGFCIGFKNNLGFNEKEVIEVKYLSERKNDAIYQYNSMQGLSTEERHQKIFRDSLLIKYIDWRYEQEWRIIKDNKGVYSYPDECIDRIIFGAKMSEENRKTIRCILKDKKVNFFEAIKSKKDFSIEVIKL